MSPDSMRRTSEQKTNSYRKKTKKYEFASNLNLSSEPIVYGENTVAGITDGMH